MRFATVSRTQAVFTKFSITCTFASLKRAPGSHYPNFAVGLHRAAYFCLCAYCSTPWKCSETYRSFPTTQLSWPGAI